MSKSILKRILSVGILMGVSLVLFQNCGSSDTSSATSTTNKHYLYSANYADNTISCFEVNNETGELTVIETISAGTGGAPNGLAVYGNKLFISKENVTSVQSNVQIFNISKATGALTPFQNFKAGETNGTDPVKSIAFSTNGKFAFVATDNATTPKVTTYSISSLTGMLNYSSEANLAKPSRIIIHPSGNYLLLSGGSANALFSYPLNSTTGVINSTPASSVSLVSPETLQITKDGKYIYVGSYGNGDIRSYEFNSSTGSLSFIEYKTISNTTRGLSLSPDETLLVGLGSSAGNVQSFEVNSSDGTLTLSDSTTSGTDPRYITFDSSGKFAYTANENSNDVSIFSIDEIGQFNLIDTVPVGNTPYSIVIFQTSI